MRLIVVAVAGHDIDRCLLLSPAAPCLRAAVLCAFVVIAAVGVAD